MFTAETSETLPSNVENLRKTSVENRTPSKFFGSISEFFGRLRTTFGNLRFNFVNLRTTLEIFRRLRTIFRNLRVNIADLRKTSEIFGRLRINSGYLWMSCGQFWMSLKDSRVYFEKLRVFVSGKYNLGLIGNL